MLGELIGETTGQKVHPLPFDRLAETGATEHVPTVFEYEIDPEGKTHAKFREWK